MANAARIIYNGEILCCLDQTEVKAIEPYCSVKTLPQSLPKRIYNWMYTFFTGKKRQMPVAPMYEAWTKVLFKDGTWIRIRIPFVEFVNSYC